MQPAITQFDNNVSEPSNNIMKPTMNKQIVQMPSGQFPKILFLTTLSNHYDILGRCRSFEERLFYILYAHKERLSHKELQRAITTQTYETLLSDKNNSQRGFWKLIPIRPLCSRTHTSLIFSIYQRDIVKKD